MNPLKYLRLALLIVSLSAWAEPLTPLATFEFPFASYDLVFDAPRGCVFVPDFYGQRLLRVSLTNGATLQEFAFTNGPMCGAISPNRQRLYLGMWQTNRQAGAASVVEIDLNRMQKVTEFPVDGRPGFIVATDNRMVVVSSPDGSFFNASTITSYSVATGAMLDQERGAYQPIPGSGDRLAWNPTQGAIYYLCAAYQAIPPLGNSVGRLSFNPVTGALTPEGTGYWNMTIVNYGFIWVFPGGTQLLLGSGEIMTSSANVQNDLKSVGYLERKPSPRVIFDTSNSSMLTLETGDLYGPPYRVNQFDLPTLNYGSSHEVASNINYYWFGADARSIWLGGRQENRTYIDTYANPARGGATNQPPVPDFVTVSPLLTTTNIVQFDASASRDDTTPLADLRFRWDWDRDGQFDAEFRSTPLAEHHFNTAGTNLVTLEVRDRFGVSARILKAVVVAQAPDFGAPWLGTHVPFRLPFLAGVAFDLQRDLLYALDSSSNRLVSVGLDNGLAGQTFSFDFPPACAAFTPDRSRLFVGLMKPNGVGGFVAEFQCEPLVKVREFSIPLAPTQIIATDSGTLVAGGNSTKGLCLQSINAANGLPISFWELGFGLRGLAINPGQDVVYAADQSWTGNSLKFSLTAGGQLTNAQYLPANSWVPGPEGEFLVLPNTGWFTRRSGEVCMPEGTIITNLGRTAFSFAADAVRGVFVTINGTRLQMFNESDFGFLGEYDLKRNYSSVGAWNGRVVAVASEGAESVIEARCLPSTNATVNLPPQVRILLPSDHTVFQDGDTVVVTLDALDLDGDVTNVVFYADGEPVPMQSFQQTVWQGTPPGEHSLIAVAQDNWGAVSTSATVRVHVNFPPIVELVSPKPDAFLVVPSTVVLAAEASDRDGRVVSVDFYRNYVWAATVTNAPFTFTFTESNRTYNVYWAIATDDTGKKTQTPDRYSYFIGLPGDDIGDAFALANLSQFSTNVSNVPATRQKSEPLHAGKLGSNSMWWTWTAPANGSLVLSTRGSSFDTVMAVYAGPFRPWLTFGGIQPVASNDDAPGLAPASRLKIEVQQNAAFYIAVDGVNGACGDIQFQLDFQPQFAGTTNDLFTFRFALSGVSNSLSADTRAATRETDEPLHAGNSGGRSLWWEWSPPGSGYVTVSTEGSDFDTVLAAYSQANWNYSPSLQNLAEVASSDDDPRGGRTSWLRFPCDGWRSYYIALDGYSGAGGQARLSIVWTPGTPQPPLNDDSTNATVLLGLHAVVTGSNQDATFETGEPLHANAGGGRSVWWKWTAPDSGLVTLSTKGSDFDTVLAVYTGTNVATLTQVAANDDDFQGGASSGLQFGARKDETYWIAVDGYGGASGKMVLSLQTQGIALSPILGSPQLKPGGLVEFDLNSGGFEQVIIDVSSDLQTWSPLGTNWLFAPASVITVPRSPDQPRQFYRIRVEK